MNISLRDGKVVFSMADGSVGRFGYKDVREASDFEDEHLGEDEEAVFDPSLDTTPADVPKGWTFDEFYQLMGWHDGEEGGECDAILARYWEDLERGVVRDPPGVVTFPA